MTEPTLDKPKEKAESRFLSGASEAPSVNYRSGPHGDIAYLKLKHSPGASGTAALFLPKGFDISRPAILMPYFHGNYGGIEDALQRQNIAEIADKSGKNIAFVIPQVGYSGRI
jgi:hypothetical protein